MGEFRNGPSAPQVRVVPRRPGPDVRAHVAESSTNVCLQEFAKSMVSFSSAAWCFTASQIGHALDFRADSPDAAANRFDAVTDALSGRLHGEFSSAFNQADRIQRRVVDLLAGATTFDFGQVVAAGGPVVQPLLSALDPVITAIDRSLPRSGVEAQWRELNNRLEIFLLVRNSGQLLRTGVQRLELPLAELVDRAYGLGRFAAMWLIEGIGHDAVVRARVRDSSPKGLLTSPQTADVPRSAQLMLHAGLGLAFAQELLAPLANDPNEAAVEAAVRAFMTRCRENSRSGQIGAAYESLGLATRTFYRELVPLIDVELARVDPEVQGYFWHGVGRAIYFLPQSFAPCTQFDWQGAYGAPHEIARLNIVAGLAWAITLVNMRHPLVMEHLLSRWGDTLSENPGFANGVASSILVRERTTPHSDFLQAFCENRILHNGESADSVWEDLITRPCAFALGALEAQLVSTDRLDSVFQYRQFDFSSAVPARRPQTSTSAA